MVYSEIPRDFCNDPDLDEFFHVDAVKYEQELLAKTYRFFHSKSGALVGLVSFLNDAITVSNNEKLKKHHYRKMPDGKRLKSYPAIKIGRLGINKQYQCKSLGTFLLTMIKEFFVTDNRTGCRFLTVDAYNNEISSRFYQKNGFSFNTKKDAEEPTRSMFFDLKSVSVKQ